ncbi:MAG: 3-oxoacyl-ACP reductase FabG [Nitrosomonas sp.]|jgi:3-oxoacyl-[acyl-carrier protein] reductase|uniref:3-oxoacyl-ACP reductase FabG n=1 Tax=Nitrosomonas sp. TaxID=42353 RepID=UPI00271DD139|nr:3-oxoacyl-ACP reductase FabG [Nitrosomonas sp.]MDO9471404.1 3-oxoacyl-ACP reductase FabG [Nitrosomonas sp.]MDP1786996.1 3-oxoacyl-ACP reductase FabG [Nitrosomonas sp.]MDP2225748.1 3-oxoacyl-ACP reductase FabG [Nitrosomonas sp.]MDP3281217.1 3-oxoacyl-ACP reductase FabG [Nitrosomonas sp.]MDP3664200.1 3-oxoacyl-ACP reductase FabG [Nitrosomonas sp.]
MILENKITLVTGASRGIGQAIALKLGQLGAVVIGTATTESGANTINQYFEKAGIKGMGITLNVNDTEQINNTIQIIREKFGEVEILINNAGVTRDNLLVRMKDEEWDEIIETDLKSVFRLSRAVLRAMMKARYGRIINMSSVVGAMGNRGQTNYAAAKAGIFGFSKSLAREVGSRNITVNCVAPGFIDTDMTRTLVDELQQNLIQHVPLGRLGRPEEVASAVAFLASSAAGYITGTTLHVNGGMYMD